MCLADELEGSFAAVGSASNSVVKLNHCAAPLTQHVGPSLDIFSPENGLVDHPPRPQDTITCHCIRHKAENLLLLPAAGSFPSNPGFQVRTPLLSSYLCSPWPTPKEDS